MGTNRLSRLLLACVSVLALLPAGSAVAQGPTDSENYVHEGVSITGEQAVSEALVCEMTLTVNTCYNSEAEAEAATSSAASIQPAAAVSCGVNYLYEFREPNYSGGGPYLGNGAVGAGWINYNSTYNATTTSFKTGSYRANFNGHTNGEGQSYGVQPACANVPNLRGSGWNNRFRSRKRFE